jgi:hypothetical protein
LLEYVVSSCRFALPGRQSLAFKLLCQYLDASQAEDYVED